MFWNLTDLRDSVVYLELPVHVSRLLCISVSEADWTRLISNNPSQNICTHYDKDGKTYIVAKNVKDISEIKPHILWHELTHVVESRGKGYATNRISNEVVAELVGLIKGDDPVVSRTNIIGYMNSKHISYILGLTDDMDKERNNIVSRAFAVLRVLTKVRLKEVENAFAQFAD